MTFNHKGVKFWVILFLILCVQNSFSQSNKAEIKVIGRGQKDKILLRWGVTSASEWKRSLKTGFIVTRFTVKKGNQILSTPEKKVLTSSVLLPSPLEDWEDFVELVNHNSFNTNHPLFNFIKLE